MTITGADTDSLHLARAIELAEGGRGGVGPNRSGGDRPAAGSCWRGLSRPSARARRAARRSPPPRTDLAGATLYVPFEPAVTRAARRRAPTRSARPASPAWSSPPTTPARTPPAAGSGSCATRGSRSSSPTASWRRAPGCSTSPSASTRAPGGPRALQVGDDPRRQGRDRSGDSKWISGESSRRRAHHWRAECDAVAVGIGTALADDPQPTPPGVEGVQRQPQGRLRLDRRACRLDSKLVTATPPRSR